MNRQLVAETTLAGLRPLGMGSRRIQDSWNEIDSYLRSALGDAYAELFAEPVPGNRGMSWFAAPEGQVTAYSDLDEEAQSALLGALEERSQTIREHIAGLAESSQDSDRRLAQTLEWALSVPERRPERDFLYSVEGQPVLVNWGTRDEGADGERAALQDFLRGEALRLHRAREAGPSPAGPGHLPPGAVVGQAAVQSNWWWLLWLLFGLIMVAIMYLLLIGCGVRGPFGLERPSWLNFCPGALAAADPNAEALEDARARGLDLERELLALQRELARKPRCAADAARLDLVPIERAPEQAEVEVVQEEETVVEEESPPEVENPPEEETSEEEVVEETVVEEEPPPEQTAESREAFEDIREEGGEEGELEIILEWQGDADLDLHVLCPDGSRIHFDRPRSPSCGGVLDVDVNKDKDDIHGEPREHITWPGTPPPGEYKVIVDNYAGRSAGPSTPVPFKVYVKRGDRVETHEGSIADVQPMGLVTTFTIP